MAKDVVVGTSGMAGELKERGRGFGATLAGFGRLIRQNPLGFAGLVIILFFAFIAIFAPWIAPYGVEDFAAGQPREGLSFDHFFGTDHLGHDIFSRTVHGARISLSVAFISVIGGAAIGTVIGIISGYLGGLIDSVIQRTVDTAIAFPALLLLLIITQVLGPSYRTVVIAIMIAIIPGVTRVVRGAALSEKNNQYIEAARALGASTPRILFRHVLPNVLAIAIVVMTTLLGAAILAEAALSFLGLGAAGGASWGRDVSMARDAFPQHIPSAFFPGAAITLTVLGFNLLGDAIRDIGDPRLRGSQ